MQFCRKSETPPSVTFSLSSNPVFGLSILGGEEFHIKMIMWVFVLQVHVFTIKSISFSHVNSILKCLQSKLHFVSNNPLSIVGQSLLNKAGTNTIVKTLSLKCQIGSPGICAGCLKNQEL